MAESSGSSSPGLQGYTTGGEEIPAGDTTSDSSGNETAIEANPRKRPPAKRPGRRRAGSLIARDARGRFVSARRELHTDVGSDDGEEILETADSLVWDGHQQPLLNLTAGTRRWSVDTQHSVPAPDADLADERLQVLPTHPEGRESAASGDLSRTIDMETVEQARDAVERALLEIEDDILPFEGKQVSRGCLADLARKAANLKKALQDGHLYLAAHDGEEYDANWRAAVTDSRRSLSVFIVALEEQRARYEEESLAAEAAREAAAAAQQTTAASRSEQDRAAAKQELIAGRVARILNEVKNLVDESAAFCAAGNASDEQLYERAEHHKVLCARLDTALDECKLMANQALDHDLIKESSEVDTAVAGLRKAKQDVDKFMLSSRRQAGVWAEKGRRAAVRGDLKMPNFAGAISDKMTVYEFEKEWVSYKAAVNYSVEEALKELKLAVQLPARAAIQKMVSEEAVFKYLKAHYGNPVLLLNAREEEMKAWASCQGTDAERREWLITAKDRLEATVALCEEHKISKYLHFSSVAGIVQSKLPADMMRDFKKVLVKHLSPSGVLEKEIVIGLLIEFIDEKILDCTLGVNLDIVDFLGSKDKQEERKVDDKKQDGAKWQQKQQQRWRDGQQSQPRTGQHNQNQAVGSGGGAGRQQRQFDPHKCVVCGGDHPALYYCEEYIKAKVADRFEMIKQQKTCGRCLTMARKFLGRKQDWWPAHERYCKTTFACKEALCAGKPKDRQLHITVCFTHATENRNNREADFVKTLDVSRLPSGLNQSNIRFLHMLALAPVVPPATAIQAAAVRDSDGYEIIPDVYESGLFLMQMLPAEEDPTKELLCFYDSGCAGAGLSNRAYRLMKTTTVREGPTILEVAGAKSILIPHGEEQFHLELEGKKQKATVTGLRMNNITAEFPLVQLAEAWRELQQAAGANTEMRSLTADAVVGGQPVDIILGIRYLKYYPQLVYSLPSGLAVYRARLKSASGCQAVLGGPHAAWTVAANQAQLMNPRVYLTAETRAWYVEQNWVRINEDKFKRTMEEVEELKEETVDCSPLVEDVVKNEGCDHCHCEEGAGGVEMYNIVGEERKLWQVEQLGTESPYRCVNCRNCSRCKKGDVLEVVSLKEEAEQFLIEQTVELDAENNTLWALLPFVEDPVVALKPNQFVAEKVLRSQLELFRKNPSMREDTLKSHKKLVDRGHVKPLTELYAKHGEQMDKLPGPGYFIPWRTVYNEGSLSTPCRMVFDASSKTPGGESLNGVLAKGQNRLAKLQHLLIRFRLGSEAVTADISMAYNGTKLKPEHLKFQKYLWKEDLDPEKETKIMAVTTLIYGVKPSGQQCQVSIEKLADYHLEQEDCQDGALALKQDTYVDDIITGQESVEKCIKVAEQVTTVLGKGSMAVKAFTFSRSKPSEAVSADGRHVGLAGYLWAPEEDQIKIDVGPPRLGRSKRGRRPTPVDGDLKEALSKCFTKRILTGLVASIFDPLGLVTPIVAGLKLDLHELCTLELDWDDQVPQELLDKWANNMEKIQELRELSFKRTVVPSDAVDQRVELLVATDASQHVGVVAIYARMLRRTGDYSCQLLTARSKLLTGLTIPKAELKSAVVAAVISNVVRANLGDRYAGTTYVTDSTVCLFWITQDDRPLQVGVRNAVSEIRRLSRQEDWYHVDTKLNVADLGTRPAQVASLGADQEWQTGQKWMERPKEQMPIKTAAEVTMTAEEKRVAATELRSGDVRGNLINLNTAVVSKRYAFSRYVVDPCKYGWTKVVRVLAIVKKFIAACREASAAHRMERRQASKAEAEVGSKEESARLVSLSAEEIESAEMYFYRKATLEIYEFCKPKEYRSCSEEKDGVLYFTGRLLDTGGLKAMERVMLDLSPVTFCRPMVDRQSPVAYSIMLETHWSAVSHLNATTTYRESLCKVFTLRGRELAQEIREKCNFCRRFKARLLEVEMGKVHETRLAIAPPFTYCQVDLMGPFEARCEHNHRATVKVWGAVFKDPASGAVFVHAMSKCDTSAFIQAYTRFAARFCHPMKLYPDEGSQLLKACADMQVSWVDVSQTLNAKHRVGVEFSPCPVGGHNYHGQVERSIREVKKLFQTVYRNIKLDVLGFETAFSWVSNELNNLPICLGSKYKNLDNLDLITPNRLIHGRSNKRAMSGPCTIERPSRMLEKMDDVFEAWWRAWYTEKLADYVAKPAKWFRSDPDLQPGDIVVFQKKAQEQVLGSPIWTLGRVVEISKSGGDGRVREVQIEYKNQDEKTWRTTHRAARSVAVLHREDDLDVMQGLNEAARAAEMTVLAMETYVDQQMAVVREVNLCRSCVEPVLCYRHSLYFSAKPFVFPDVV